MHFVWDFGMEGENIVFGTEKGIILPLTKMLSPTDDVTLSDSRLRAEKYIRSFKRVLFNRSFNTQYKVTARTKSVAYQLSISI